MTNTSSKKRGPRIRGTLNSPRSPQPPENVLCFPWRFLIGDKVVRVGDEGPFLRVVSGFLHLGYMPHYTLTDRHGHKHTVPQIHLSVYNP